MTDFPESSLDHDVLIVAPNAAIDSYYETEKLEPAQVMRAHRAFHTAGGKGHNMARAATRLGGKVLSLGISGGSAGKFIEAQLEEEGIPHHTVWSSLETRRCNTIYAENTPDTTVILDEGLEVPVDIQEQFTEAALTLAQRSKYMVLIGSLPAGFHDDYYKQLLDRLEGMNIHTSLDCSGRPLRFGAMAAPSILKVNKREFAKAFAQGDPVLDPVTIHRLHLETSNPENVSLIVTDGAAGALVFPAGAEPFRVRTELSDWVSTAGAGDTFMAGLIISLAQGRDLAAAAQYASAAAAANLLKLGCGFLDPKQVPDLLKQTTVVDISKEVEG